jgi:hypothetical protein
MKFKDDRPFSTPDAAEQKLLVLANGIEPDHAGRLSIGVINKQFMDGGGSGDEFRAVVKAAVVHGWFTLHPSVATRFRSSRGGNVCISRRNRLKSTIFKSCRLFRFRLIARARCDLVPVPDLRSKLQVGAR